MGNCFASTVVERGGKDLKSVGILSQPGCYSTLFFRGNALQKGNVFALQDAVIPAVLKRILYFFSFCTLGWEPLRPLDLLLT